MNTIFMNSEKSKISDPHRQLFNLSDKINLKRSDKYVALSNLSIYYTQKNTKKHQLRQRMKTLNYMMDHILYQMFKIILNISVKKP